MGFGKKNDEDDPPFDADPPKKRKKRGAERVEQPVEDDGKRERKFVPSTKEDLKRYAKAGKKRNMARHESKAQRKSNRRLATALRGEELRQALLEGDDIHVFRNNLFEKFVDMCKLKEKEVPRYREYLSERDGEGRLMFEIISIMSAMTWNDLNTLAHTALTSDEGPLGLAAKTWTEAFHFARQVMLLAFTAVEKKGSLRLTDRSVLDDWPVEPRKRPSKEDKKMSEKEIEEQRLASLKASAEAEGDEEDEDDEDADEDGDDEGDDEDEDEDAADEKDDDEDEDEKPAKKAKGKGKAKKAKGKKAKDEDEDSDDEDEDEDSEDDEDDEDDPEETNKDVKTAKKDKAKIKKAKDKAKAKAAKEAEDEDSEDEDSEDEKPKKSKGFAKGKRNKGSKEKETEVKKGKKSKKAKEDKPAKKDKPAKAGKVKLEDSTKLKRGKKRPGGGPKSKLANEIIPKSGITFKALIAAAKEEGIDGSKVRVWVPRFIKRGFITVA